MKKNLAELIGTFWLVFGGCGSAVLAAGEPGVGIGWLGVSLAFGLTVFTMACAIGPISGCHLNPAVSIGLCAAGRFSARELPGYIVSQVLGATLAAGALFLIKANSLTPDIGGFATNGFDEASPKGYNMVAAMLTEVVMTAIFLFVILRATAKNSNAALAPLAIGLCLTLIHLVSIPVTNTSVNPARSSGVALFVGGLAIQQLWLFWIAPIVGALVGSATYKAVSCCDKESCKH